LFVVCVVAALIAGVVFVAEWFAGAGAFAASAVALWVAVRAQADAREARRAVARDRAADLLVQLVRAVERDIAKAEDLRVPGIIVRSPEAASLCRALYGRRNVFGTTWHVYCEEDQQWIHDLRARGELFPRMRDELQDALDKLDAEDR
jgi:hypothetical protein